MEAGFTGFGFGFVFLEGGSGQPGSTRSKKMKTLYAGIAEKTAAQKAYCRGRMDIVRQRANFLDGRDRALMQLYLDAGTSIRQLARLIDTHEAKVARKINRLMKRLNDRRYIIFLRNRDRFGKAQMSIARDYFVRGLSIRQMAEQRGCTFYRMQRQVKNICELVERLSA
jgi:hypothetical protein